MKQQNVKKASSVLNLQKNIIGVKFVDFQEDYEKIDLPTPEKNGPLCYLYREAMDGKMLKATDKNVTCEYSNFALGLSKPDNTITEGRSYHYSGLYESRVIAKKIVSSMKYLSHEIYGIVVGPLELMEDADVVIMVDYAETIMRVMQGYAYKFGSPSNLNFFGNQAACGDLTSKPYHNNDINISLMCKGMRANGRFEKGEIGVSIPINIFDGLVEGIVATVNPVCNSKEKNRIVGEICSSELGVEIDINYNYGIGLREYDGRVRDLRGSKE